MSITTLRYGGGHAPRYIEWTKLRGRGEVFTEARVTTEGIARDQRRALIRDAAFSLFNLEVELDSGDPTALSADIRIERGPCGGVVRVDTSCSTVERTAARARAAESGNFLLYYIRQGGSRFRNARGQEFETAAGSVVIGSQDAAYKARQAAGRDWAFNVISVPEHLLPICGRGIRDDGFRMVPAQAPLGGLVSSYVANLCATFPRLDAASASAAVRGLDHLLGASRGEHESHLEASAPVSGERVRVALSYIERNIESPALGPAAIARHLCVSTRQLHRAFESAGIGITAEIRKRRVARARQLLRGTDLPVTEVAYSCGFDSMATFYRSLKEAFGATASELRHPE